MRIENKEDGVSALERRQKSCPFVMVIGMRKILEHQGIQLFKNGRQFFLVYDEGELAVRVRELRITQKEADLILDHPESAYDIIIKYQNRELDLL